MNSHAAASSSNAMVPTTRIRSTSFRDEHQREVWHHHLV